ncbi:MAG: glutaredoxin [Candidatus Magasanikbacteria bacterium]|jgi:glutaredoxin 3|nr:glutaredoxin [Candidatus Magasanikbacteria bacterium]MBT5263101.1 glutaredoxin [Candidatus Magasanikbacteria bacterium]MBT5820120.1 glutaredoxin [Candidatus Magasanikbacteria bacterium]MBT6294580.1 glutaredoxin [Candidatus Magasanikbacteria bacterium]
MKKITIYTTPTCPYCNNAKELFDSLNLTYTSVDVSVDTAKRDELVEKYDWQTVPAIFFDDELVGGYDDVQALHNENTLMEKLA